MEDDVECDIINQLFACNLDEVLQTVFLKLDPVSLKRARCVCQQWNQFILQRLWGSKPARNRLQARLHHRWITRPSVEIVDLFKTERTIYFLTCDDKFVYSGTGEGFAEVHCLATGKRVLELDCKSKKNREEFGEFVQLDVGREVLATVYKYNVCIWLKSSGERVYQGSHHGKQSVFGIKVTSNGKVITGAGDGSVVVLQPDVENRWEVAHKLTDVQEEITHIDTDGDWMVSGTRRAVYFWDLSVPAVVPVTRVTDIKPWMITLSLPFMFVVGGDEWPGLHVWNIKNNKGVHSVELVRSVNLSERYFHNIHSNGRFVVVCEARPYVVDEYEDRYIFVFDEKELVDSKISDKKLSKRVRISEVKRYELLNAAVNRTSLLVSQPDSVNIQNFWDGPTLESSSA